MNKQLLEKAAQELGRAAQALSEAIEASEVEGVSTPYLTSENVSEDDLELQVVGYMAEVDGVRYLSPTIPGIKSQVGPQNRTFFTVVKRMDAQARIDDLSNIVISLNETIEDLEAKIEKMKLENVLDVPIRFGEPKFLRLVEDLTKIQRKEGVWDKETSTLTTQVAKELHPSSVILLQRFITSLAHKMRLAEEKYKYTDGWSRDDWEKECRMHLRAHLLKGDPRDVAIYAAFMWAHGWSTAHEDELE